MGYALKPAKYVEYYADVTEQNTLVMENTTEYSTSNQEANKKECFEFQLMMDIHFASWFSISFEHKEDGGDRINLEIVNQNGTTVFSDRPVNAAAWTSDDHYFAPYYVYSTRMNLGDNYTFYIWSDNGNTVYLKNIQVFGFKTPFEPSSFLPP